MAATARSAVSRVSLPERRVSGAAALRAPRGERARSAATTTARQAATRSAPTKDSVWDAARPPAGEAPPAAPARRRPSHARRHHSVDDDDELGDRCWLPPCLLLRARRRPAIYR